MGKKKAVIADGSVFARALLRSHLESLGLETVAIAKDVQEASHCLQLNPDLAIMDIAIAESGDFALVKGLSQSTPSCYIIVMIPEGQGFPEVVVESVRAGARGYLKKPISPEDLKLRVSSPQR